MTSPPAPPFEPWPALPLEQWQDTRDTLHLWTQVVGKIRLALAPAANHWWHVPLYVDARGLTTSLMPYRGRGLEVVFDLTSHELQLLSTLGARRRMSLGPRSVADFTAEFRSHLRALDVDVPIHPVPVEVSEAIPFDQDTEHASYDADAVHRFWTSLVSAHRVLSRFRGEFRGKASPVHFFWGAFDLAVTRFSGRPAPRHPGGVPHCPDSVMVEAYSDEVSSCGYWPGGAAEGVFYAYAYPEPAGYRTSPVAPGTATFDEALGEFVLPYADVRQAADPDGHLLDFLSSTHAAAARTAGWPTT
ncbi:DUF5996 family protein [Modestobacter altitudinis]|uniref:DUF5996 family protein n=1 Tax=Modestobacter altitudinis TaxID=2213158 RepID=UPI00110D1238|nr:DUF5996 family protein [Modestobacter altitudinis]